VAQGACGIKQTYADGASEEIAILDQADGAMPIDVAERVADARVNYPVLLNDMAQAVLIRVRRIGCKM
jgi:hypothetical protein